MSAPDLLTSSGVILDSLTDGVYVCDTERRIVFWSKAAERITGWRPAEVVGRRCLDGVLCHVDKDGHLLCGKEFCPLHRSMVTGTQDLVGLIIYAQSSTGGRIPTQVTVSPIRNAAGEVVGGVEMFRDVSQMVAELNRAKRIQSLSLEMDLPEDPRVSFSAHYVPHDIVGGDFYALKKLDADHYGFLLADVMGHGVAAALHTMHLSSVWERHHHLLAEPVTFARAVNAELARVVKGESFATALCGVIYAEDRTVRSVSAGGPSGLVVRGDGRVEQLESTGYPLGMLEDAEFEEVQTTFAVGDALLLFTDGAVEIQNARGEQLGSEGLEDILRRTGYPGNALQISALEEQLLRYSNNIRLSDDLTFIDVRF
jgi:PAS domain S-box-containing protein